MKLEGVCKEHEERIEKLEASDQDTWEEIYKLKKQIEKLEEKVKKLEDKKCQH